MSTTHDTKPTYPIPSFYELRELYRRFLRFLIEDARNRGEIREDDPQQVEGFLAKNQKEFFLLLLEETPASKRFKEHLAKDGAAKLLDPAALLQAGSALFEECELGLIGCHYRSFGLGTLRTSAYHATPRFNAKIRELSLMEVDPGEDFQRQLLAAYFDLFTKNKTFNQQIFNSSPQGPLGFIFKSESEVSEEERHESFVLGSMEEARSIPARLKLPLMEDGCLKILLRAQGKISNGEWLDHRAALSRSRAALLKSAGHSRWGTRLKDFLAKKLPLMEPQTEDILMLLQSYLVYGLTAGRCVYTFPSAQAELPTCGFTIMCDKPLRSESIEFLQRLSELIYGELFGSTLAQAYRRQVTELLRFPRAGQRLLQLISDERASFALLATLAGTPIPIRALETFLSFARRLPQAITYERRRYDLLMVLVHPEYLEGFLDQIVRRRSQAPRKPLAFLYNDDLSMEHASHDMRIHVSERSAPEHILFFTYPPFDPSIIDTSHWSFSGDQEEPLPGSHEKLRREEAVKSREAILLIDCISTKALHRSPVLARNLTKQIGSGQRHRGDEIVAALTIGNKEALALSYEPSNEKARIYHDGSLVLEAEFYRWGLPPNDVFMFRQNLTRVIRNFFQGVRENGSSPPLAEQITDRLLDLVHAKSRSRAGLFLIFHPEAIPARWRQLGNPQRSIMPTHDLPINALAGHIENIFDSIYESSLTDGAIVLSRSAHRIRVYNKVLVNTRTSRTEQVLKSLQTSWEYPALRSFGTKHTAAYEYTLTGAQEKGFALTVSSDGPISLFYPDEISQELSDQLDRRGLSSRRRVTIVRI